jgi:uncharacterized protein
MAVQQALARSPLTKPFLRDKHHLSGAQSDEAPWLCVQRYGSRDFPVDIRKSGHNDNWILPFHRKGRMKNWMSSISASDNPLDVAATRKARGVAALRLFGFLAIAIGLTAAAIVLVVHVLKIKIDLDAGLTVWILLIAQVFQAILTVVIPTTLMIRLAREPATYFGWGRADRLRQLVIGLVTGVGLVTVLLMILAMLGGFSFGSPSLSLMQAIPYGLGYALVFALTAIAEEGFLRGYGLVQLSRAISFWPAAIITSVAFAALHLTHSTETPTGIIQAGVVGLVLAYSFRRSGALWFAWGFHAAWDFAQTFLFGVPDSGMSVSNVLMHSNLHGPAWLTGGSAGPEGSLFALPITAVAAVIAHFALKTRATNAS